jgi:hypothetical protein
MAALNMCTVTVSLGSKPAEPNTGRGEHEEFIVESYEEFVASQTV